MAAQLGAALAIRGRFPSAERILDHPRRKTGILAEVVEQARSVEPPHIRAIPLLRVVIRAGQKLDAGKSEWPHLGRDVLTGEFDSPLERRDLRALSAALLLLWRRG